MVIKLKESKDGQYVIVDSKTGEMFISARKERSSFDGSIHYFPDFTSFKRNNYQRAKRFNTEQEANDFLKSKKDIFKYSLCKVMTYDDALNALGNIEDKQAKDKEERERNRKDNAQAYRQHQKEKDAKNKEHDPGRYRVTFYYANSWLGAETYEVDADSVNDAFKKAKQKALDRDEYAGTSGYDYRLVFNKNYIKKLS